MATIENITPTISDQTIAEMLVETAANEDSCYRAAIHLLVAHDSWIHHVQARAYLSSGKRPSMPGELRFNFFQAAAAIQLGELLGTPEERAIMLIAASMAVGVKTNLDALIALPENKTHMVLEAIAIMLDRTVTNSENNLG